MIEWLESHQIACWYKSIFGFPCPGCGFQTAILFLLKGEFIASIKSYPALFPLIFFIILAILKISGVKKIHSNIIKKCGFFCLTIILISYLFTLSDFV